MYDMKMYLIHGVDKSREPRMINEFLKAGIDLSGVQWIRHPNKDELSDNLINAIILNDPTSPIKPWSYRINNIPKGIVSCTYKHYLALKDIVENRIQYGLIMEDNMQFINGINIPERVKLYIDQLNTYYPDWDVLFDLKNGPPSEYNTYFPDRHVYPRRHTHNNLWHGGARCASFYIVNYNSALKLYNNYIPFNTAPDAWMCDLFRKLDMKIFWAEPNAVEPWQHVSTAT